MKHQNTDSNQGKPERVGDNHDGTKFNQTEDASARLRLAAFERPTTSTRDNARQLEAQNLVIADQRTSLSDAQKQAQIGRLSGNQREPSGTLNGAQRPLYTLSITHPLLRAWAKKAAWRLFRGMPFCQH
ncbi:MAG: hypothetical protein IPI39_09230 [Candidatus Obscuribacter sp.]|nr:hypothetical protein [Candidatus Obscuribacter sp.]